MNCMKIDTLENARIFCTSSLCKGDMPHFSKVVKRMQCHKKKVEE